LEPRGKGAEALQVAAVAFKRVIGQSAFHAQVCEIGVDQVVGPSQSRLDFL
jgi:hypothetical protein